LEENKKLIIVFLVPSDLKGKIRDEYENLKVKSPDVSYSRTWTDICNDIQELLCKEQACGISPLSDDIRQTIKAFSNFIQEGFSGYACYDDLPKKYSSLNPDADKGRKTIWEIEHDDSIKTVGVQYGRGGFPKMKMKIKAEGIETVTFQCSSTIPPGGQWLDRKNFLDEINKILK
jgi:hypothetical protein